MQVTPLLLATAAPLVAKSIESTGKTVASIGHAFASVLSASNAGTPESTPQAATSHQNNDLKQLAEQLRGWLDASGESGKFELRARSDRDGRFDVKANGPAAERVQELLAQHPEWLTALRQFASQLQSASNVVNVSSVLLRISDQSDQTGYRLETA